MAVHKTINIIIALVWLVNGLLCKILNLVPRHQEIVGRILSDDYAIILTKLIGIGEVAIAIWILLGIFSKLNCWVQIILVVVMNILEFILVPEYLLWGKGNLPFALLFAALVFVNYYYLGKNKVGHA